MDRPGGKWWSSPNKGVALGTGVLASIYLDGAAPVSGVMSYLAFDPPVVFGAQVLRVVDLTSRFRESSFGHRHPQKKRAVRVIRFKALTACEVIGDPGRVETRLALREQQREYPD